MDTKSFSPKITFGIIVLNGEPFIRYNLRQIYSYAHQIIVIEGAVQSAYDIATTDGHSLDNTLEILKKFKATEDPDDKLIIITTDGYWFEKDEMSQAYAKHATGDFIWQVDIDEFYTEKDLKFVFDLLKDRPEITTISFKQISFWGGFDYISDGFYLRSGGEMFHRVFKWGKGYKYISHRPPTIVNEKHQNLRHIHWVNGNQLAEQGIFLYHYSLIFPKQAKEKSQYYSQAPWAKKARNMNNWFNESYLVLGKPFRVHNVYHYPSWLEYYKGDHPEQIQNLIEDIEKNGLEIEQRQTEDIEKLLNSRKYKLGKIILKTLSPLVIFFIRIKRLFNK